MDAKRDEKLKLAYGQAFKRFRLAAGLSQEKLGSKAGVHRNYVGDVERGLANICLLHMWKLSQVLNTQPSLILGEAERQLATSVK